MLQEITRKWEIKTGKESTQTNTQIEAIVGKLRVQYRNNLNNTQTHPLPDSQKGSHKDEPTSNLERQPEAQQLRVSNSVKNEQEADHDTSEYLGSVTNP